MQKQKWIAIGVVVVVALGATAYAERVRILDVVREQTAPRLPISMAYQAAQKPVTSTTAAEVNLAVPFTVQAPTGDWSQPYQDACEEASVLMVKEYYAKSGTKVINSATATKEILAMVAYQDKLFGFNRDTTSAETAKFAEGLYGLGRSEILENPTLEQLKERLNKGQPIIIPVAGQLLKNPFFTPPGPTYHMAVIRGYTKNNQFIVNDPGTKRGNSFLYSFETIMSAIHDWNGGANILEGKKNVLILHPKK